uniref:FAS1 domain-containing protein n=1 Tax=Ditylum brightwellii TaxID=49249 RepID=A0A7S1ZJ04_9STRA|mmetsp:Transcript_32859/g.48938  ORF Transcript_32859/g.48938 Transcript_32859/m.48938 type:complete len:217 (+) Transcript_32859:128-778(+)
MMNHFAALTATLLFLGSTCAAFQVISPIVSSTKASPLRSSIILQDAVSDVQDALKKDYSKFYSLIMSKNDEVWKTIGSGSASSGDDVVAGAGGFTIFAPSDAAMDALGEKKLQQLIDDRNRETVEKIAAFHAVVEPVGAWDLINSGGLKTLGGEVPVGKTKVGGFFGFGGKEDGGITVNGAKIKKTTQIDNCVVHEMDGLISLQLLWRYMDQLRIV